MSNFSDIGFHLENENELFNLVQEVFDLGESVKTNKGTYRVYSDPSGAELWIQLSRRLELLGVNPHFKGKSRRRVSLMEEVDRKISKLDFALYAWAEPQDDDPESGLYPFVFDLPDGRRHPRFSFPMFTDIQLTAFAMDMEIFYDEEDFANSQEAEYKMASQSFIPIGLFKNEEDESLPPDSFGMFAGEIKEFKRLTNTMTGEEFFWFFVETLGGEVDVVADVFLIEEEPEIGGIIYGQFWLSGKLLLEKESEEEGFFSRLFS